ncbi:MAG: hypothetical protein CVU22_06110 [Betaproteobacteria bacterium HGW-Betaproteobacteria-16]|nr:MAG: hypothetical protein CVU22_06110 [Betaproteobacteria bacterium HGW-Betaproteobacteria-16]
MDSRAKLWVGYFSALLDALGPNRNQLSIPQRLLFITWPAFWLLLLGTHGIARKGELIEPFQSVFESLWYVSLVGSAWLWLTAWAFKDRIRSSQMLGQLGVRPRILVYLCLTLLAAVGSMYVRPPNP